MDKFIMIPIMVELTSRYNKAGEALETKWAYTGVDECIRLSDIIKMYVGDSLKEVVVIADLHKMGKTKKYCIPAPQGQKECLAMIKAIIGDFCKSDFLNLHQYFEYCYPKRFEMLEGAEW